MTIAAALTAGLQRYATRLVTFTKARDRQEAIDRYLARERAVLIGPAMERGVDLPDEACRVVVIPARAVPISGGSACGRAGQARRAVVRAPGDRDDRGDDPDDRARDATRGGFTCSYILDSQILKIRTTSSTRSGCRSGGRIASSTSRGSGDGGSVRRLSGLRIGRGAMKSGRTMGRSRA